ncbi:MAG: ribonuclease HI family protein [Terracidiphilus sp.]
MTRNLFDAPDSSAPHPSVQDGWLTAHCDGGSRGNPGPSGYGAVIEDPQGRIVARLAQFLGIQTNNFAEYSGLLAVLQWAIENGAKRLRVVSDSELMVKQMKGQYKVASPGLRPLYEQARRLASRLEKFEMRHTLRGGNQEADHLANEAMDKGMGKPASQPVSDSASQPSHGAHTAAGPIGVSKPAAKAPRQVIEGYVKDGVVHLLEGELPDGIFVKVIRE